MHTTTEAPLTCTVEEAAFCSKHTEAVCAYIEGSFADAMNLFNRAEEIANTGEGARISPCSKRSGELVRDLCEKYLKEGRPDDFDGVFRALEK